MNSTEFLNRAWRDEDENIQANRSQYGEEVFDLAYVHHRAYVVITASNIYARTRRESEIEITRLLKMQQMIFNEIEANYGDITHSDIF